MYLPAHFAETRLEMLHAAMRAAPLATLVTLTEAGLMATHLPLVLDPAAGAFGTLYGHVARGNPQWRDSVPDVAALAIFVGPEAYISPSWYPSRAEHGQVVPTWNYLAVHASGPLRTYDDPEHLLAHVTRLTAQHEGGLPSPWHVSDAPADYVQGMLRGIVGIELPIQKLEGKWKMSQNRVVPDRLGAAAGLEATGDPEDAAVAALIRERLG